MSNGPKIRFDKQGKHIPGHNNYQPGKSEWTHPDPQALLDQFAGISLQAQVSELIKENWLISEHSSAFTLTL